MIHLANISTYYGRKIYVKLEGNNPGGSVKDRVAIYCVTQAERRGDLRASSVLIESTSGNLGVGLALVGAAKGYRVICVVDPKTTPANMKLMTLYGAELIIAKDADAFGSYLQCRTDMTKELVAMHPDYWWLRQYENPDNPNTHYVHTGPELARDLRGRLDWIVIPVGTGGMLGGLSKYFKAHFPQCKIMAADAVGSVALGGTAGVRWQLGVGSSFPSQHIDPSVVDSMVHVSDLEAFEAARFLLQMDGLMLGGSSGTAMAAILKMIDMFDANSSIAFVSPDTGLKYIETVYNDEWVREKTGKRLR